MFNTPKMGIPWMSEYEDPFILTDQAKAVAVDNWLQAIYENGMIGVGTDAIFYVDTTAGTITWNKQIVFKSSQTGGILRVLPNTVACADLDGLHVVLPSRPIAPGITDVVLVAGPPIGVSQNSLLLGQRVGEKFYTMPMSIIPNIFAERSFACYEERAANGADAGDFNSGAWVTRTLNTTLEEEGPDIARAPATSVVTVRRGKYFVSASAPAYRVDKHMTRLFDVTNMSTLLQGTSEISSETTGLLIPTFVQTRSFVEGYFEATRQIDIALQHRCILTKTVDGLGLGDWGAGSDFGEPETFARLRIRRIE